MSGDSTPRRRAAYEANILTSTTTLRAVMKDPGRGLGHPLSGLRSIGVIDPGMSGNAVLGAVTQWMLKHYRNESVYKNAIANRILLERHSLSSASLLSEFKVASSVADCVVINGRASVYEIKTELDNPAKLLRQVHDYSKVFRAVSVVTHRSLGGLYLDLLEDSPIGVITLNDDGRLHTRRRARLDGKHLSVDAMMRSLRKPEYTRIAEAITGRQVDVPPTRHFSRCLEIARTVSVLDYCHLLEGQLRLRVVRERELIATDRFKDVRHQLIKIDPSARQLSNLTEWMTGRI